MQTSRPESSLVTHPLLICTAISVIGAGLAFVSLRLLWRAIGHYKVRKAGPRPLVGVHHRLWRDPGDVERLDLSAGPGGRDGAPRPPFHFIEEHLNGSQPCMSVRDGRGRRWRVKWGHEVQPETFAVRLAWACGYFAEVTHYVREGQVDRAEGLTRTASCVDEAGCFRDARFELDDPDVLKLFEEHSWSWTDNPFVGTRELAGLRVLMMLMSNWDNKDQRDVARGSNTAIYVQRVSRWKREAQYMIIDWGGSMGRWGATPVTRGRWDPDAFATQTPQFVTGVTDGFVQFGYTGQRTADARESITVESVAWLCRSLGRITDQQLRAALGASGATPEEQESFTTSLRLRIEQLRQVSAAADRSGVRPPYRV
jgi:hypothetical protein